MVSPVWRDPEMRGELVAMIAEAKVSRQIIAHNSIAFGELRWTGDEFATELDNGNFRMSRENFSLIPLAAYRKELEAQQTAAANKYHALRAKLEKLPKT